MIAREIVTQPQQPAGQAPARAAAEQRARRRSRACSRARSWSRRRSPPGVDDRGGARSRPTSPEGRARGAGRRGSRRAGAAVRVARRRRARRRCRRWRRARACWPWRGGPAFDEERMLPRHAADRGRRRASRTRATSARCCARRRRRAPPAPTWPRAARTRCRGRRCAASMGSAFRLPHVRGLGRGRRARAPARARRDARSRPWPRAATATTRWTSRGPVAFVLGQRGRGPVRRSSPPAADRAVAIPMAAPRGEPERRGGRGHPALRGRAGSGARLTASPAFGLRSAHEPSGAADGSGLLFPGRTPRPTAPAPDAPAGRPHAAAHAGRDPRPGGGARPGHAAAAARSRPTAPLASSCGARPARARRRSPTSSAGTPPRTSRR